MFGKLKTVATDVEKLLATADPFSSKAITTAKQVLSDFENKHPSEAVTVLLKFFMSFIDKATSQAKAPTVIPVTPTTPLPTTPLTPQA